MADLGGTYALELQGGSRLIFSSFRKVTAKVKFGAARLVFVDEN